MFTILFSVRSTEYNEQATVQSGGPLQILLMPSAFTTVHNGKARRFVMFKAQSIEPQSLSLDAVAQVGRDNKGREYGPDVPKPHGV
jgi:hypothetical protein